jgi:hypothetical protein
MAVVCDVVHLLDVVPRVDRLLFEAKMRHRQPARLVRVVRRVRLSMQFCVRNDQLVRLLLRPDGKGGTASSSSASEPSAARPAEFCIPFPMSGNEAISFWACTSSKNPVIAPIEASPGLFRSQIQDFQNRDVSEAFNFVSSVIFKRLAE